MNLPTPQDLRERRTDLGLTQSELADRADVSQPLVARIEGGDVDPRLSTLRRIVTALDEAEGSIVRAGDLMTEDIVSIGPDDLVSEAVARMQNHGFSQLPVVENGLPIGWISESAVVRGGDEVGDHLVQHHMDENLVQISRDRTLNEISNHLDHTEALMVTEGGETVGIVTQADVAARLS